MATYKQLYDTEGIINTQVIERVDDGAFIPNTDSNRDWVAYLAWLALGNIPLPPDPLPTPAQITALQRAEAISYVSAPQANYKLLRSLLLSLIDQVNECRQRFNDLQSDVQTSNNINQIQAKWALRLPMPARTETDIKTAMIAFITSGAADN